MSKMTEATMPEGGGRCSGSEDSSGARRCWEERVAVTCAIAPGDHAPCLKVLHREAKWVKLNGTIIISSETTYGNQILNNVRRH
jgi:hypothetical protein